MGIKLSDISRFPDGTIVVKYANGFIFEGFGDNRDNPISGILRTPDGIKYDIPDFKDEDIYSVFNMIKRGELKHYILKEAEQ